jgi:uncharacterized membrane protein YphA (DoxX/SURF4 family)
MNAWTKFFLILLRVAIGWHLLFAGLAKFQADYKGSEGYLQESAGPFSPAFHWMAGDRLAEKLTVDPDASKKPAERFPKVLDAEWKDYYENFARYYALTPEQRQRCEGPVLDPAAHIALGGQARALDGKIESVKQKAVAWMTTEEVTIKKTSPYGPPAEFKKTVPDWVKEYQARREKIRQETAGEYRYSLGTLFAADRTRDLGVEKADVSRIRNELSQGLDGYTKEMKESLRDVLTPEQAQKPPLPDTTKPGWMSMTRLDWVDFLVRWSLTIIGACVLLGFFTRLNCVAGALLLLSFYLAVPPLPGLPELFRAEGYPYINKNIVELLALLTLATTRSGRWAGIDGLLYYLNPFCKKTPEPRQVVPGRPETYVPVQVAANESARAPVYSPPHAQAKS